MSCVFSIGEPIQYWLNQKGLWGGTALPPPLELSNANTGSDGKKLSMRDARKKCTMLTLLHGSEI